MFVPLEMCKYCRTSAPSEDPDQPTHPRNFFPFLNGGICRAAFYGLNIFQLILLDQQVKSVTMIIEIKF